LCSKNQFILLADDLKTMTNTLQTALTPLLNIGSFCGLGLLEYPLGHPRPYISCLFIFAVWSFFTYSVYYPTYFFIITERHMTPLAIMVIATNIIISITIIISILINFFYFKVKIFKYIYSYYSIPNIIWSFKIS